MEHRHGAPPHRRDHPGPFLYSAIHELVRYRSEGRAEYGLSYDEETGTTHVAAIDEETEAYDLDDFDPADYRDPEISPDPHEARS